MADKAESTSEAFLVTATESSTARTEAPTLTAGRTLDALIAEKVFGARWEFVSVGNVVARLVAPLPMDWILASQYGDGTVIHAARSEVLPYYSTDIAAAHAVLDKLIEAKRYPEMQFGPTEPNGEPLWRVSLVNPADTDVFAESLPLAICRAALRFVEAR